MACLGGSGVAGPSELSPAMEDCLEAIVRLSEGEKGAKVTDIAEALRIAEASVTQGVTALRDAGLVVQERYGRVHLTEKGKRRADMVRRRQVWLAHT